jgi:sugar lactone lactonase YvrE
MPVHCPSRPLVPMLAGEADGEWPSRKQLVQSRRDRAVVEPMRMIVRLKTARLACNPTCRGRGVMNIRQPSAIGLALALMFTYPLITEAAAQEQFRPHSNAILHSFPGAQVYPESVAVDPATGTFFVGSVKEGTIFKGKLGGGKFEIFSPAGADGRTMATGLFYAKGRLVVCGRQTGQIFVYDTRTGRLISKFHNGLDGVNQTFLNDTTFAADGSAYVTDSVNPVLYRVAPTQGGKYELQEFLKFEGTPVKYLKAEGAPGINVNGIVASADGRYLVIAKRNENALFRVDLKSKQIVPVELPKDTLNTPDGMFLQGTTLYVMQNLPKAVAVLKLSQDLTKATLERSIPHPTFAFPTSVARLRDKLLVVSAQFDTKGSPAAVTGNNPPVVPFWVSEIPAD